MATFGTIVTSVTVATCTAALEPPNEETVAVKLPTLGAAVSWSAICESVTDVIVPLPELSCTVAVPPAAASKFAPAMTREVAVIER